MATRIWIGKCAARLPWLLPAPNQIGRSFLVSSLALALVCQLAWSETPGSDSQAIAMAKAALSALGRVPPEVAIRADAAVLVQGAMQKGTVELLAQGPRSWRTELELPSGHWSHGHHRGHEKFSNTKNTSDKGVHERWALSLGPDFFPASSLLARYSDPDVRLEWVGKEEFAGKPADHIRMVLGGAGADAAAKYPNRAMLIRTKSEDFYLDPNTHLVRGLRYCAMAESASGRSYPEIEVRFDDYRVVSGTASPFVIEKYLTGNLIARYAVTEIDFSRHLSANDFDLPGEIQR